MDKDTSEIAKLAERIAKDPKSKLFVPLAEEYKKAGDIEMSIRVLMEGLKNNPGYVTARSFLGRLLFEKGDMAGAQKEFEEVAKSIPDNLMAQRKLGDLYVLQNRPADALQHYKIAVSLNPGDEEMAALVSELEAGRDVKERLLKPKPPTGEKQPAKEEFAQPQAARAQMKPSPSPTMAKQPVTTPVTAPSAMEREEPEEVLVVMPLEEPETGPQGRRGEEMQSQAGGPAEGKPPAEFDFLAEKEHGAGTVAEAEEPVGSPFDITGTSTVETEAAAKIPEAPKEKADDFTTDTLAELYIAQGFYEKAIDIYQRMLADNPDSQKLQDKLAHVRSMASQAESPGEFKIEVKQASATEEEVIFLGGPEQPLGAESGPTQKTGLDEHIRPPAYETKEATPPGSFDTGFEPREHAPAQVAEKPQPVETKPQPVETKTPQPVETKTPEPVETKPQPILKSPAASRKETIERLEGWLKNIMKEK